MRDEKQFALKIVQALDSGVQSLDAATAARLAGARQRAISAMAARERLAYAEPVLAGWHRLVEFSHHGGYRFWLPLLLLLAALAMMLSATLPSYNNKPIDVDALLLASDLPPEAYADKEFVAWLENSSQH